MVRWIAGYEFQRDAVGRGAVVVTGVPAGALGACWPSACDAWNDAYRGILIFAQ